MNEILHGHIIARINTYNSNYFHQIFFIPDDQYLKQDYPRLFLCHRPHSLVTPKNGIYNFSNIESLIREKGYHTPIAATLSFQSFKINKNSDYYIDRESKYQIKLDDDNQISIWEFIA